MTTFFSKAPIHEVTDESFFELNDGEGDQAGRRFTRQVHWLLECEASLLFVHGGKVVSTGDVEFSDRHGFLNSARDALEEAEIQAEDFSVDQSSSLKLVVNVEIKARPVLKANPDDRRPEYMTIPDTWLQEDGMYEDIPQYKRLGQTRHILHMSKLWSTQNTTDENKALSQAFFDRWESK